MTLRVGLAALGWTGFIVSGFLITTHGLGYPDVHWALAMPQLFEPATSDVWDYVGQPRRAEPKPDPKTVKSQQAAGHSLSPQAPPQTPPTRVAGRPAGPTRPTAKPAAPPQLHWHANPAALKPFSPETHYLSLPAYVRYVVHERTGRWITFGEAAKMVRQNTIPIEATAVNP